MELDKNGKLFFGADLLWDLLALVAGCGVVLGGAVLCDGCSTVQFEAVQLGAM